MKLPDIDLDLAPGHRQELINAIDCTIAVMRDGSRHNSGIYITEIPKNPFNGYANIDYVEAETLGYFKIDLLTNSVYGLIKDQEHYDKMLAKEPNWDLLLNKEFVAQLSHLANYHNILSQMRPKSIEQLAMVLAIIRPGKKHLIGCSWIKIADEVWDSTDDGYVFKKSHATSYSMMVALHMNLIEELNTSPSVT